MCSVLFYHLCSLDQPFVVDADSSQDNSLGIVQLGQISVNHVAGDEGNVLWRAHPRKTDSIVSECRSVNILLQETLWVGIDV